MIKATTYFHEQYYLPLPLEIVFAFPPPIILSFRKDIFGFSDLFLFFGSFVLMSQFGDFSLFISSHFPEVILSIVPTIYSCQHFHIFFLLSCFFIVSFRSLILLEAITFLAYPSTLLLWRKCDFFSFMMMSLYYIMFHIAICYYFLYHMKLYIYPYVKNVGMNGCEWNMIVYLHACYTPHAITT